MTCQIAGGTRNTGAAVRPALGNFCSCTRFFAAETCMAPSRMTSVVLSMSRAREGKLLDRKSVV